MQDKRPKQITLRYKDADHRLIDAIKAKTGIKATSEQIRSALYEQAARLGVKVESEIDSIKGNPL